jgi:hypothetical protein
MGNAKLQPINMGNSHLYLQTGQSQKIRKANMSENISLPAPQPTPDDRFTCPVCQTVARPGELICPSCGKFIGDEKAATPLETNHFIADTSETFQCSGCQEPCAVGSPACLHCGRLFVEVRDTAELDQNLAARSTVRWPAGEISVDEQQPIWLVINGKQVSIPVAPVVIIGRLAQSPYLIDDRIHVDLSTFDAYEQGVSRQHVKIIRKYGLLYVADMGSSNGTALNGTQLAPHADRVIRSGDELRLGRLTMRVIFPNTATLQQAAELPVKPPLTNKPASNG